MPTDKQPLPKSGSTHQVKVVSGWSELDQGQDETVWLAELRHQIRTIIGRAVIVYLVLFLSLGLFISLLGADPLANNGLLPKALAIFVGLALLIALINTVARQTQARGTGWLMRGLIKRTHEEQPDISEDKN